jgi:hypothetical protein
MSVIRIVLSTRVRLERTCNGQILRKTLGQRIKSDYELIGIRLGSCERDRMIDFGGQWG